MHNYIRQISLTAFHGNIKNKLFIFVWFKFNFFSSPIIPNILTYLHLETSEAFYFEGLSFMCRITELRDR